MVIYIYCIKNTVNNKLYIGQTIQDVEHRLYQHIQSSKTSNSVFHKAIRDIGACHFSIHIIEECDSSLLNDRERYYIKLYNTFHNGYNSTLGGFGNHIYELDEPKIINMYKDFGLDYIAHEMRCNKSVIRSILVKDSIEIRYANNHNKPVIMLDNIEVVQRFESTKQAWMWLVSNYRDNIKSSEAYTYIKKSCLYGSTAFGYKWMYLDDLDDLSDTSILNNIEIQKMNKYNIKEGKLSESKRNPYKNISSNRNKSGRPGIKCSLSVGDKYLKFDSLKDLAHYISVLEGSEITNDKKLRDKAYILKRYAIQNLNYKGMKIMLDE